MPRIRCHYVDCVFIDDGFCSAAAVEIDPDMGCTTFSRATDLDVDEDMEFEEIDDWDELDDDDDLWLDDEDDF